MSTPFHDVYEIFLNDIRDNKFIDLLTPDELGDVLKDYLYESADIHFASCEKDLSDRDDVLEQFNIVLTSEEQRILAKGMRLKWLSSNFVANEQLLNSRLTTKDYNIFSPANHLKELSNLERSFSKELKSLIINYHYRNMIRGV